MEKCFVSILFNIYTYYQARKIRSLTVVYHTHATAHINFCATHPVVGMSMLVAYVLYRTCVFLISISRVVPVQNAQTSSTTDVCVFAYCNNSSKAEANLLG